jgi:hypothetical protein
MTGQYGLYNLFGGSAAPELKTIGYYLYVETLKADLVKRGVVPTFGELSALGLILTFIMVPLTLGVRKVLKKVGPSD